MKIYYCIECSKKIHYSTALYGSNRCGSCAAKIRAKDPTKHSHYIDGRTLKRYFCIDCKKEIGYIAERCKSCAKKQKNNPSYVDDRYSKQYSCIDCGKEISKYSGIYGTGRCNACANKKRWQDIKFREKTIKASFEGRKVTPNKPEMLLNKLLNNLLPNQYTFVGNGELIVGGFCPDFVNKDNNKIIEMFGCYWHKCKECGFGKERKIDKQRLKTYKKLDYKILIIWEHELKDLNKVKEKILEFNNG